jgi:metal-responsive CopG/Arc/MetJ family transcriptional regulator
VKTAVSIPDEIFRSAEAVVKRLRISRSELYARALAEYVHDHERKRLTQRINDALGDTENGLNPMLKQLQSASIEAREDW